MNTLILIGGITASGKTTLTKELNVLIENSNHYRRYQAYSDIAKLKGIDEKNKHTQISSKEVDDYFVNICKMSGITISDTHYAVQMSRDSKNCEKFDIYQKYVPTISKELISKLIMNDIKVISIFLSCPPEVCLERAIERFNKKERELRAQSLLDVQLENASEKREWDNLCKCDFVDSILLDSSKYTPHQLSVIILDYLKQNKYIENNKVLSKNI